MLGSVGQMCYNTVKCHSTTSENLPQNIIASEGLLNLVGFVEQMFMLTGYAGQIE